MKIAVNPKVKIVLEFDTPDGGKVEYPCTKPSLGAVRELEESVAVARKSGGSGTKIMIEHLVRCGLPEAVAESLDGDQLEMIMAAMQPAKKN